MSRRSNFLPELALQRDRLYERDLDRWAEWLQQQERLRALVPKALDVLESALSGDEPDVKLALGLLKLLDLAEPVPSPGGIVSYTFVDEGEVRARLSAHQSDADDAPTMPAGE